MSKYLSRARVPMVALLVGLAAGATDLAAQERERRGGGMTRTEMQSRIFRHFDERVTRELGLSADQAERVRTISIEFRASRGELMRERGEVRRAMRRHLASGGDEAAAGALIQRMQALRAREVSLQRQEEERLLQVLSASQLLQLQALRDEFSERIRRLERGGGPGDAPEHGASRHEDP